MTKEVRLEVAIWEHTGVGHMKAALSVYLDINVVDGLPHNICNTNQQKADVQQSRLYELGSLRLTMQYLSNYQTILMFFEAY